VPNFNSVEPSLTVIVGVISFPVYVYVPSTVAVTVESVRDFPTNSDSTFCTYAHLSAFTSVRSALL